MLRRYKKKVSDKEKGGKEEGEANGEPAEEGENGHEEHVEEEQEKVVRPN